LLKKKKRMFVGSAIFRGVCAQVWGKENLPGKKSFGEKEQKKMLFLGEKLSGENLAKEREKSGKPRKGPPRKKKVVRDGGGQSLKTQRGNGCKQNQTCW